MALLDAPQESHIVFGTCNRNFTQYRRLRFWDEKLKVFYVAYHPSSTSSTSEPRTLCQGSSSSPTPARSRSIKWGKAFKNMRDHHQGESSSSSKIGQEPQSECNQTHSTSQSKRPLMRGSSEKFLFVNRFKKASDLSPDRRWRPRLSLRKKSFSLDTPEMSPEPGHDLRKNCSSTERICNI
eukprot:TRINITY_DN37388_c0_g1_i1.p1 TRINITY_DN37388_c0_g1~~TRINITY_DN37388_c0_g1_i1.p1  ORF type:complete len:181 (-),score=41.82 TRINITY_DN37388_c0_g1_i1:77-619(-)